jgi:UDP-3-O-[3-hydroxymyristoyl] glucosamine N-acyltransferase
VLGKNVVLAGQVGVADHVSVGDGTTVYGQAGLHGSIEAGSMLGGSPAMDARTWMRAAAAFTKLPAMQRTIRALEERLAALERTATEREP